MKQYKYSILLPHLNEGYLVDIMLDSIFNVVKYDNFEILIADDGSKNLSDLDSLKNHPLKDKIKIFYFDSLGPSKLRHFLGNEATGDILIFSDAHMYFEDDFLTKINTIFNDRDDVGILQTTIGDYKNKSLNADFMYFEEFNGEMKWKNFKGEGLLLEIPMCVGNSTIVKRDIFCKIGGYNLSMIGRGLEDMEFSMRAWLLGYKCFLTKEIKFIHHFRTSFHNYDVKRENVLKNKLIFVYTCFQTQKYIDEFTKNLKEDYNDIFEEIHASLLQETNFWIWLDSMRRDYVYDDERYLNKFKDYYDGYQLIQ